MTHQGTKPLQTTRLNLRRFTTGDAKAMYNNWASDPQVSKYLTWPAHASPEVTKGILENWVPQYANDNFYTWAIVLNENGDDPIGSISVVNIHERTKTVEIGYCIGAKWWGQGIVSEAFGLLIKFLFEEVKVNRIEAVHDPRNPASGKVMEKCGLVYEGCLREAGYNNQGVSDKMMYAVLARDYKG